MSNKAINLTRNDIARIVNNDPRAIRAFEELFKLTSEGGTAAWVNIDFADSDLADIEIRPHSALQDIEEADETSTDTTKDKHVSDNQLKVAYDDIDANATNIATNVAAIAANDERIKTNEVLLWLSM